MLKVPFPLVLSFFHHTPTSLSLMYLSQQYVETLGPDLLPGLWYSVVSIVPP